MPRDSGETSFPTEELGAPARRALEGAGHPTLEQLAEAGEGEIEELHGVGPSAQTTLREALEAHSTSFREGV